MAPVFTLLFLIFVNAAHAQYELDPTPPIDRSINNNAEQTSEFSLDKEPTGIVKGLVHVVSGAYSDSEVDLALPGQADPLFLQRFSGNNRSWSGSPYDELFGKTWKLNHSHEVGFSTVEDEKTKTTKLYATFIENGAFKTKYEGSAPEKKDKTPPSQFRQINHLGKTNCSMGFISGQTNLKNRIVTRDKEVKVLTGAGSEFYFKNRTEKQKVHPDYYACAKEKRPSGNWLTYEYDEKGRLAEIKVLNRLKKAISTVKFSYYFDDKSDPRVIAKTDDDRKVTYHLIKKKNADNIHDFQLKRVERPQYPTVSYFTESGKAGKKYPNGRFVQAEFYKEGKNDVEGVSVKLEPFDERIGKVKLLKTPSGVDQKPITTHRFFYHGNYKVIDKLNKKFIDGTTGVHDILGRKTDYHYDTSLRIDRVMRFQDNTPYSVERLFWGKDQNEANLIARTIEDHTGDKHFCRYYQYDGHGNVLEEQMFGNLTGRNTIGIGIQSDGTPLKNGCEYFQKSYSYSEDGFNLMLSEDDGRKKTTYEYYPQSNLLKAKFLWNNFGICQREFYTYDDSGSLILEIIDDGATSDSKNLQGVTERHIKHITNTSIGLPHIIEEAFLDHRTHRETFLKKTINTHDRCGNMIRQDVYDANQKLAYSLHWEYDDAGRITREVDALGHVIDRWYDDNGNFIKEQGPNPHYHRQYTYDYCDRLIKSEDVHSNGLRLSKSHRYNALGEKIGSTDIYGNETTYDYDSQGRIATIHYPPVSDENGRVTYPIERFTYNILGYVASKTDPRGNTTSTAYTLRGDPCLINYPDGSMERFEYAIDGLLEKFYAKNGSITIYKRDFLGRPILTETYSPSGELLSSRSAAYSTFHLLSETDESGLVTNFQYDGAGRLSLKCSGEQKVAYQYDALGRLSKTLEYFGYGDSDYIVKAKEYDLLDRIIEERVEDSKHLILKKVNYGYDNDGNCSEIIAYNQAGSAVTLTSYNAYHEPEMVIDSEGNCTKTIFHYSYRNSSNQGVACHEVIDPLGNMTFTVFDALGRVAEISKKNSMGEAIQKEEYLYDAAGNRCKTIQTVYTPEKKKKKQVVQWVYDCLNRVITCIEGVDTEDQRETKTIYNLVGQKERIVKPSGVSLHHRYDALNRLTLLEASDRSLAYQYIYDRNNNLIRVDNLVDGSSTSKCYDSNNRLVEETLSNGLKVQTAYDRLDRPIRVTLQDGSSIAYDYQSCFLKTVRRLRPTGEESYRHEYLEYDLSGNVLSSRMIGNAGLSTNTYDLKNRIAAIAMDQWSEALTYDSAGNLKACSYDDSVGNIRCEYQYDDLYQLIYEKDDVEHNYVCDSNYNRVSKDGVNAKLNGLNQLLADGEKTFKYDLNGNMILKVADGRTTSYCYDALDRLIEVKDSGQQTIYQYDELNRRMSKSSENNQERFLYLGQNEIGSFDKKGIATCLRVLGNGKGAEIGAAVAIELHGTAYATVHDHNGNVRSLVHAGNGKVEESYRYSAYGEESLFDKHGNNIDLSANPWRFASKRFDAETGFVYFGRRYYDSEQGRWVTADPIGYEAGPNLYAYVMNNPLTHIDLYGLYHLPNATSFGSRISSFFGRISSMVSSFLRLPGRVIEYVGRNWVPIPLLRDGIEATGRFFSGRSMSGYVPSFKIHSGNFSTDNGTEMDGVRVTMSNGIATSFKEMKARCESLAEELGVKVHYHWNASKGFIYDAIEQLCVKLGIPTNATRQLEENFNQQKIGMGGKGDIWHLAHSQGGSMTDFVAPRVMGNPDINMRVYSMGSATAIAPNKFDRVRNFVCLADPVPFCMDPIGTLKGFLNNSVSILPLQGPFWKAHHYDGETYKSARRQFIDDFRDAYGKP